MSALGERADGGGESGDRGRGWGAVAAVVVLLLVVAVLGLVGDEGDGDVLVEGRSDAASDPAQGDRPADETGAGPDDERPAEAVGPTDGPVFPQPDLFGRNRTLVAFYGTAGTGALGVLGEGPPDRVIGRLTQAARAFERPGRPVQVVFELIVTVADATPGRDGDYSHDIARADVERYVRAARRHDALLVLDLQPGRAGFSEVARRWEWALRDPRVGLALDPEWRMAPGEVPGRVIGSVDAAEVNEVSLWLANLARALGLPQKLFVLHQFRTDMIERIDRIAARDRLAMVQHVDGFGTPGQKLDTYRTVLRPERFEPGFKLFYDEDRPLMRPAAVLAVRPAVRFVSYQ